MATTKTTAKTAKKTTAAKSDAATTAVETENIIIPALELKEYTIRIVGDSPLISHAWSEKAKRMMLDKQQKKASIGREIRRPVHEFANSLYWLTEKPDLDNMNETEVLKAVDEATFGFPTIAFKAAGVDGAFQSGAIAKKTTARAAFHILEEFAVIEGKPEMREDITRVGMGTADLRYRATFPEWSTTLKLRVNTRAASIEQIVNLLNIGGFACGIGDWRPARDGMSGRFHVE